MYIPRKRKTTLKQYGKYIRVIEAPEVLEQNDAESNKGGKRETNYNTPKARTNYSHSAYRTLAIALNNKWRWYGHLQLAKEDITTFADAYKAIKTFTKRLQKQKERTEEKNFAYMIIPDFKEHDNVQKWFLHIWLMNVPNEDKTFSKDLTADKKTVYHWKKFEKQNGRSELYKIYDSGYTTNNQRQEKNAFQIFEIMKRTASVIPKNKSLYYTSGDLTADIIIAEGRPSEIHKVSDSPDGNPFVKSEWVKGKNLQENIDEAMKYLLMSDAAETWANEVTENDLSEEPEQQKESFFSFNNYCIEGECIPPADDSYYYSEPMQDFDYSVLNDIYENEVNGFD